jgi:hypothetical protein
MSFLSEQKVSTLKLFTGLFRANLSYSYKPWKKRQNTPVLKIGEKPQRSGFFQGFFEVLDVAFDLPGIKYKDD